MRTVRRIGMVVLSALAMLALLLAIAALSLGRPDAFAFYAVVGIVAVWIVRALWRPERAQRRAEEALLPPERRPTRRVPRRAIAFPLVEGLLTVLFWYVVVVVVDRVITRETTAFTLLAIAPFAAFMLATITIAGRHMAFRLTAEDADPER